MKYSDKEKLVILHHYKTCEDMAVKGVLRKLLLDAEILHLKTWKPGDPVPTKKFDKKEEK